jgi:hypothetical protein
MAEGHDGVKPIMTMNYGLIFFLQTLKLSSINSVL